MNKAERLPARAWFLVQCKASQDERAEINLLHQGYTCFRPTHRRERVLHGRRRVVCQSLFPSYLFIQLGANDSWSPLRSTRGVSRVVAFGGKPLPVRDELITQLQERASTHVIATFNPGDKVTILDRGFAGIESIFMTMDGDERVILLINLMNRQQQVSMPLASITPV